MPTRHPSLITVSGQPGSGSTSLATTLADDYDYEYVSGGDIFRGELADARDMTLAELTAAAETDPSIDKELDYRLQQRIRDHATGDPDTGLVVESRLAGWLAGHLADLRIWTRAPTDVRATRVTDRTETTADFHARERSEKQRYREFYDVNLDDLSIYDLVVNTQKWSPTDVCYLAEAATTCYTPADHEPTDSPLDPLSIPDPPTIS